MVRTFIPQPQQEAEQILLAKRMFFVGCLGLPWLWFVNAWYFRIKLAEVRRPNPELVKWVRRSALGSVLAALLFFSWIIIFQLKWKSWGRRAVDFMINAPESFSTLW